MLTYLARRIREADEAGRALHGKFPAIAMDERDIWRDVLSAIIHLCDKPYGDCEIGTENARMYRGTIGSLTEETVGDEGMVIAACQWLHPAWHSHIIGDNAWRSRLAGYIGAVFGRFDADCIITMHAITIYFWRSVGVILARWKLQKTNQFVATKIARLEKQLRIIRRRPMIGELPPVNATVMSTRNVMMLVASSTCNDNGLEQTANFAWQLADGIEPALPRAPPARMLNSPSF